jgi:hypothetical protein
MASIHLADEKAASELALLSSVRMLQELRNEVLAYKIT